MGFSSKMKNCKGSMMIEIIIVISIITVSTLAAMAVAQKSIYLARQSTHASQAAFLLEEGAEATRIVRDNAWSGISSLTANTNYYLKFSGGTWITSSTSTDGIVDIFTRKVSITGVNRDNTTKDISAIGT